MRCDLCKYPCKEIAIKCDNFYPKEEYLGNPIHFEEDPTLHYGKHERTSRMCVVCKEYFNRSKIKWVKLEHGLYPLCLECARRHTFIAQNVPVG